MSAICRRAKKDVPEKFKSENWAHLGVNVDDDFEPVYIVPADKKEAGRQSSKKLLKEADNLYLATDEDREGEAISWHLQEVLKPKVPVHRLVFHEITNEAIQVPCADPREIDRRPGPSPGNPPDPRPPVRLRHVERCCGARSAAGRRAGRVQSVAVRLIVERERERMAFVSASYWDLVAYFRHRASKSRSAPLVDGRGNEDPIRQGLRFRDRAAQESEFCCLDEAPARQLAARLQTPSFLSPASRSNHSRSPARPLPPARCNKRRTANLASPRSAR